MLLPLKPVSGCQFDPGGARGASEMRCDIEISQSLLILKVKDGGYTTK